jgi:hypothetical protein
MRVRKRNQTKTSTAGEADISSQRNRRNGAGHTASKRTSQNSGPSGNGSDAGRAEGNGRASSHRNRNSYKGSRGNRNRRQKQRQDHAGFWGDQSKLPPARTDVRMTDHPAAVPQSLGQPPLPGHETIAEHYFGAVYDRAVTTAGALAAAGGLIDPDALLDERGH